MYHGSPPFIHQFRYVIFVKIDTYYVVIKFAAAVPPVALRYSISVMNVTTT